MSEAEKIAELEREIQDLQKSINLLAIYHMQDINILRSIMLRNGWERDIKVGSEEVNAFSAYGELFDRVREILPWEKAE